MDPTTPSREVCRWRLMHAMPRDKVGLDYVKVGVGQMCFERASGGRIEFVL